jgi:hypothetical protein
MRAAHNMFTMRFQRKGRGTRFVSLPLSSTMKGPISYLRRTFSGREGVGWGTFEGKEGERWMMFEGSEGLGGRAGRTSSHRERSSRGRR